MSEDTAETEEKATEGVKCENITYRICKYSDWNKLRHQLIPLEDVADYGWDAHIISMMMQYKILPNRYVWSQKVYFRREDVIRVNNQMITNEVNRYKMFDDYRKRQADILLQAAQEAKATETQEPATEETEHE